MKFLILFLLISFSVFAEKLDVDVTQAEILAREVVVDARIVEIDNRIATIPGEITPIQNLINSKTVERDALPAEDPQIEILQAEIDELASQRQGLVDEDNALDIEKPLKVDRKRQLQWMTRVNSLPDIRMSISKAGYSAANIKVFIKDFVLANDETKLTAMETAIPLVVAELQKTAIEAGIDARFNCAGKVKKKMFYLNYGKGLTKTHVKKFVKDMADIIDLIDAASLESSREDILAVAADGTIITEADKTEMVAVIDSCK